MNMFTAHLGCTADRNRLGPFFLFKSHRSNEQKPWLFRVFVGDDILPSYVGILLTHYNDPY